MSIKYDILDANRILKYDRVYEAINDILGINNSVYKKACFPEVIGNGHFQVWLSKASEQRNDRLISLCEINQTYY